MTKKEISLEEAVKHRFPDVSKRSVTRLRNDLKRVRHALAEIERHASNDYHRARECEVAIFSALEIADGMVKRNAGYPDIVVAVLHELRKVPRCPTCRDQGDKICIACGRNL